MHPNDPAADLLQLKVPPHSTEAERSLLGALLIDNQAFDKVADVVSAADFYQDDHRRIWRHVSRLIEANRPADMLTTWESISDSEDRDKTGGAVYLASLAQNTPGAANIRAYAKLVRERSVQRRMAQVGTQIAERALNPDGADIGVMLDEAESAVFQIAEEGQRKDQGPTEIRPLLARVFERIDQRYHRDNPNDITGVATGFVDLDRLTAGLQPGNLVIIAARPSMGKTALALNIAEHSAVDNGLPVAIFSMEMSGTELTERLLSSISRVDSHKIKTGRLTDGEWGALSDAMTKLHEVPLEIDDSGALNALELRARARRLRRKHGRLGLIVIDYLQLMSPMRQGDNRSTELSEITRSLKAMAKELDCPVVCLSQLNRRVDERPDRRPMMSDLRDSGAIEQDADVVLFVYREAVYRQDLAEEFKVVAEVILGKQRNGPVDTVRLCFFGQFTRFENASHDMPRIPMRERAAPKRSVVSVDFKSKAGGD